MRLASPVAARFFSRLLAPAAPALVAAMGLLWATDAHAGNADNLLRFAPSETRAVVGLNIESIRDSLLWVHLETLNRAAGDVGTTIENIPDFDLRTNVKSVLVAATDLDEEGKGVAILDVEYSADSVASYLLGQGFTESAVSGIRVFTRGLTAIAFIKDDRVAAGAPSVVNTVCQIAAGEAEGGLGGTVRRQANAADKSNDIWVAVDMPSSVEGTEGLHASLDFSAGLAAVATLRMESEQGATDTAAQATSVVAGLAASPEAAAIGVGGLASGLSVVADGEDVKFTLSLDAATVNQALSSAIAIAEEQLR